MTVTVTAKPCELVTTSAPAPVRALNYNSVTVMPYTSTDTTTPKQTVVYDFTRFFFNWATPCQEAEIDNMITLGTFFKISVSDSNVVASVDSNNILLTVANDVAANTVLTVQYCPAADAKTTCVGGTTSQQVSIVADCSALYPAAASSKSLGAYTGVSTPTTLVADVGNLYNTCNGLQPTAFMKTTGIPYVTCTFNSDSDFLSSANKISVTGLPNRLNAWSVPATFSVTCNLDGSTAKVQSKAVTVSYDGCSA